MNLIERLEQAERPSRELCAGFVLALLTIEEARGTFNTGNPKAPFCRTERAQKARETSERVIAAIKGTDQ